VAIYDILNLLLDYSQTSNFNNVKRLLFLFLPITFIFLTSLLLSDFYFVKIMIHKLKR